MSKQKRQSNSLEQMFAEHPSPDRCTGNEICKGLSMSLNFSDSRRGLICSLIVNLTKGTTYRRVSYFGGDFKKGMIINYCPFCGNKVPKMACSEDWTKDDAIDNRK